MLPKARPGLPWHCLYVASLSTLPVPAGATECRALLPGPFSTSLGPARSRSPRPFGGVDPVQYPIHKQAASKHLLIDGAHHSPERLFVLLANSRRATRRMAHGKLYAAEHCAAAAGGSADARSAVSACSTAKTTEET